MQRLHNLRDNFVKMNTLGCITMYKEGSRAWQHKDNRQAMRVGIYP